MFLFLWVEVVFEDLLMQQSNLESELSKLKKRTTESVKGPPDAKKKPVKARSRPVKQSVLPKTPSDQVKPPQKTQSPLLKPEPRPAESYQSKLKRTLVPLSKRLKDATTVLLDVRAPLSIAELCEKTKFEPGDRELWQALSRSQRTEVLPDGRYLYKSQLTNVREKGDLLGHVRRTPEGTVWLDIKDAYIGVEKDLEELQKERKLFVLNNPDLEDNVVYPNDPGLDVQPACAAVIQLWRETMVPDEASKMEDALQNAKIEPSRKRGLEKRAVIPKTRKKAEKKDFKYRKLTNVHMPGLFDIPQPEQID